MKLFVTEVLVLACALVAGLPGGLPGGEPRSPAQDSRDSQEGEHETELALCMERIEQSLKAVRRNLKDEGSRPEALREILELARGTIEARGLVPEMAAKIPEGERGAFVDDYRRMMIDFERATLDLEVAVIDGDPAVIQAAFDTVRAFEDRGHERFSEEEE